MNHVKNDFGFSTFYDQDKNEVRLKLKGSNYNDSFACIILAPEGQELSVCDKIKSFFLTLFSWKYIAIPNTNILRAPQVIQLSWMRFCGKPHPNPRNFLTEGQGNWECLDFCVNKT